MKSSKSEFLYFFLSVLVLGALAALYLVFGRNYGSYQVKTSEPTQVSTAKENTEREITPEEKQLAELETAIADLEKAPNNEKLTSLQGQVATVADQGKKAELQTRLDAITTELTNQTAAETAVANAEGYQVLYNVEVAQNAINLVTNEGKKAELQKRLDAVSAAIQAATQNTYVETSFASTETATQ